MRRTGLPWILAASLFAGPASGQVDEDQARDPQETLPKVYRAPAEEDTGWHQDVLVALIGGGARFRSVDLTVGGAMPERNLETGAYFEFGWHLLIRPMGSRSPRRSIRAMLLQLDGGAGFPLQLQRDPGIVLDANLWRMVGQLGYVYPFDRVLFGGLIGIGGDVFNIDLNSVLPSSRIVYARLGPAVERAWLRDFLKIRADFGLRFPFHLGEMANAFGQDSRAFGLDATVALSGRIEAGFTYSLRFIWEWYTYRFAGPVDDVPATGNGGRGTDNAIDVQLLVGWSL